MNSSRIQEFDSALYMSITEASRILGWSSNTQSARIRLKAAGVKISSSYVRGDDVIPLYSRNEIMKLKAAQNPPPPPPAPTLVHRNPAPNAAQPNAPSSAGVNIDLVHAAPMDKATKDALQFTIQRLERMVTELSHAPQAISNAPIIERLDQLLKRPATPLTSSEGLRDLQTQTIALNGKMEEMMRGMHALTQIQLQILEAVTKP